ncbi:MAG: hypothetical protein J6S14_02320 [Clostridia bacterium]|nr:hypothetical protein [Clostridia bacterium]
MNNTNFVVEAQPTEIGTSCQICDRFIPLGYIVNAAYPRICKECKKRLCMLLYGEEEVKE